MYKFSSFNGDDFEKAIQEKKYSTLISYVVNVMRINPEFKNDKNQDKSEAEIALDILRHRVPEIFEKYELQGGEKVLSKELILGLNLEDLEECFLRQTFLFSENFCEKRIEDIKFIGQEIAKRNTANFSKPQNQNQTGQSNKKQKSRSLNPLILGIALLIIIVLVVALAVKK
ncbi:MAG: hypothetical protein J6C07_06895 [Lachnospiraceae bacterium]|nr:hypothetical protein [Lachnospiraceae bacterium]